MASELNVLDLLLLFFAIGAVEWLESSPTAVWLEATAVGRGTVNLLEGSCWRSSESSSIRCSFKCFDFSTLALKSKPPHGLSRCATRLLCRQLYGCRLGYLAVTAVGVLPFDAPCDAPESGPLLRYLVRLPSASEALVYQGT